MLNHENVRVVCGEQHFHETVRQIKSLGLSPKGKLICEPSGRNTAPAILLAVLHMLAFDKDAVLCIFPADHVIKDLAGFHDRLRAAIALVNDGHIAEDEALKAQEQCDKKKSSLVSYLVEKALVDGKIIATAAAEEFGIPVFDIEVIELETDIVKMVDEKLVRKHHALPLYKRGNRLFVAVSDPTNLQALDEIKFHVGMTTEAILVQDDKLRKIIERALEADRIIMY